MTDTELLDGLQRLFDENVAALRSCRSGVKIEISRGDFSWREASVGPFPVREYFGTGYPGHEEQFGTDIRGAIRKAIAGEAT